LRPHRPTTAASSPGMGRDRAYASPLMSRGHCTERSWLWAGCRGAWLVSTVMPSGASSLPAPGGEPGGTGLPALDRLRAALRPAQLPLPTPRDTREAAGRVNDLLHAERHREARALVEQFRDAPAEPEDRFALLRAALHGAALSG